MSVAPLSVPANKIVPKNEAGWAIVPLPAYPSPQTVHGGDAIALDLLMSSSTGQKIVDYIRIEDRRREVYRSPGPARDFSVADVELRLMDPRLSINPKRPTFDGELRRWSRRGRNLVFHPDFGRYYLLLAPRPDLGFQKAGEIRGNVLKFNIGGNTIALDCNGRIAPGKTAYNLYVLHNAGWHPNNSEGRQAFGMTAG